MELLRFLALLRRRKLLIVLAVILAVAAAYSSTDRTPRYTATSTLYVGSRNFDGSTSTDQLSADRLVALDRVMLTFANLLQSSVVASDAVVRAGLDRSPALVAGHTIAAPIPGTQLLQVSVVDTDPTIARRLSIAIAETFVQRATELEDATSGTASSAEGANVVPTGIPVALFERAAEPLAPQPTGLMKNVALAALVGFLLAAGVIFAIEYLDVTVHDVDDVERRLAVPVLAAVPMLVGELSIAARVRADVRDAGPAESSSSWVA